MKDLSKKSVGDIIDLIGDNFKGLYRLGTCTPVRFLAIGYSRDISKDFLIRKTGISPKEALYNLYLALNVNKASA